MPGVQVGGALKLRFEWQPGSPHRMQPAAAQSEFGRKVQDFLTTMTTDLATLPIEELNEYIPSIEAITADQAQAAAQKYIESDSPIIVVVGSPDVVKPQLEPHRADPVLLYFVSRS